MDRDQILSLYAWDEGICFRHPGKGVTATTVVKRIRTRDEAEYEVRACEECLIGLEDIRREEAARSGSEFEPGHAGVERKSFCAGRTADGDCDSRGESGE